jgi:hypothetical protein
MKRILCLILFLLVAAIGTNTASPTKLVFEPPGIEQSDQADFVLQMTPDNHFACTAEVCENSPGVLFITVPSFSDVNFYTADLQFYGTDLSNNSIADVYISNTEAKELTTLSDYRFPELCRIRKL